MNLAEKFRDNVSEENRVLGQALLQAGSCSVTAASADMVAAEVREGSQLFDVHWDLVQRKLTASCDCPMFRENHALCPHLWAALLAADGQGELIHALKRNVPQRILLPAAGSASSGQPDTTYEPVIRTRRRSSLIDLPTAGVTYDTHDSQLPSSARPRPGSHLFRTDMAPQAATLLYLVHPQKQRPDALVLTLAWRPTTPPGTPPPPAKSLTMVPGEPAPSPVLAQLLAWQTSPWQPTTITLPLRHLKDFLSLLDRQNLLRCLDTSSSRPEIHPLTPFVQPGLELVPILSPAANGLFQLQATIPLPDRTVSLTEALTVWPQGAVLTPHTLILCDFHGQDHLAHSLCGQPPQCLTRGAAQNLARHLLLDKAVSRENLPSELRPEILTPDLQPRLYVKTAVYKYQGREQLHAELSFQYLNTIIDYTDKRTQVPSETDTTILRRNLAAEQACALTLANLGFRWNDNPKDEEVGWKLPPASLDHAVRTLVTQDWFVSAQGKSFRKPTTKTAAIVSRIDWFELQGTVDFDGVQVTLPQLLRAKQQGQKAVRLDDGTYGILPLEWLENFTALTELGDLASDKIKFKLHQAALVAALVQDVHVAFDQTFEANLQGLREPVLQPTNPPQPFHATLRPYQQQGLAWLLHMNRCGLGACLADDMGLGKTIQILALLQTRHAQGVRRPSLVVMPKSLIFNWEAEKEKFCPQLTSLIYTGTTRRQLLPKLPQADLVFTTYGTLRNDVLALAKIHFDYCILDESQAIKNQDSSTAEATRAIRADYRVAMTGTPIENKLAELFSQLDFLNPGLMGRLVAKQDLNASRLSHETYRRIRQAVRCLILRRTKEQVTPNLPQKTEQILWCDMDNLQQAEYDALKHHLLKKLQDTEDNPDTHATFDALAALLKLRQAACHPGLAFANRQQDDSPKTDTLMSCLASLVPQGHKVLVFSQFTSFLHIVEEKLRQHQIPYLYLDGQTEDRQAVVRQFQEDSQRPVFLISLKAGGVGLNLTAADYIFILDPWWNPATEAQAIDRAYRIGQTKPVFAYKLITRNTIEEKVQKLQETKRRLARSILGTKSRQAQALTQDDIAFLLS